MRFSYCISVLLALHCDSARKEARDLNFESEALLLPLTLFTRRTGAGFNPD